MRYLIVIDMQNDFITGSLGTPEATAIVPKVAEKIAGCDGVVLFTQDTHYSDYLSTQEGKNLQVEHCIAGSYGWEISEDVANAFLGGDMPKGILTRNTFRKNTFGSVGLANYLKGVAKPDEDEIEIIGLCTDICVVSNALLIKAFIPEIRITVDSACCAGVTPQKHLAALETMRSCQINVV